VTALKISFIPYYEYTPVVIKLPQANSGNDNNSGNLLMVIERCTSLDWRATILPCYALASESKSIGLMVCAATIRSIGRTGDEFNIE
jgi:ribosomal protein L28